MRWGLVMASDVTRDESIVSVKKPMTANVGGFLTAIVGIMGLTESLFIIFSPIIFGWLIMAGIGFFALASGIAILIGADWGWGIATLTCILSLFAGFIEIIGSFDPYLRITGLSDIAGTIGVITVIVSGTSLYFLYRPEVVEWETYRI